jgi:hypothetical protein
MRKFDGAFAVAFAVCLITAIAALTWKSYLHGIVMLALTAVSGLAFWLHSSPEK